jgi:hypothetical protein
MEFSIFSCTYLPFKCPNLLSIFFCFKIYTFCQAWWCTREAEAPQKMRKEDCKFEASQVYLARPFLKKTKINKIKYIHFYFKIDFKFFIQIFVSV